LKRPKVINFIKRQVLLHCRNCKYCSVVELKYPPAIL